MERQFKLLLFAMRWLLAPLYFGLGLLLIMFAVQFFRELIHIFETATSLLEVDLILASLTLIDLTLVASLVVMVMLSGYENFVSKLDIDADTEKLGWLGKLDANSLKLKVASSIVAISSIHLLRAFMDARETPNDKLLWYVIIHLTFVVSALLMGVLDRIAFASHRGPSDSGASHE
jgi:uncharacterized protein (TIGR00645 family)